MEAIAKTAVDRLWRALVGRIQARMVSPASGNVPRCALTRWRSASGLMYGGYCQNRCRPLVASFGRTDPGSHGLAGVWQCASMRIDAVAISQRTHVWRLLPKPL